MALKQEIQMRLQREHFHLKINNYQQAEITLNYYLQIRMERLQGKLSIMYI